MNTKSAFLFTGLSLLLSVSSAFADGQRSRPMTQLDFDQPAALAPARRIPSGEQISEILEPAKAPAERAPAHPVKQVAAPVENPATKTDSTARASMDLPPAAKPAAAGTKFDWVKPQEGTSHYLIPRLKGPAVDKSNAAAITTAATWRRTGAVACQDVSDIEGLCNKAKALKEVLSRFSGNDEFFESQCQQTCSAENQVAVLTGFAAKSAPDAEFQMNDSNRVCRYQIRSSAEPPRWQMLQGERGTCTCLPKSCM